MGRREKREGERSVTDPYTQKPCVVVLLAGVLVKSPALLLSIMAPSKKQQQSLSLSHLLAQFKSSHVAEEEATPVVRNSLSTPPPPSARQESSFNWGTDERTNEEVELSRTHTHLSREKM